MADDQGHDEPPMQTSMELEHAIGFNGNLRGCLLFHPNGRDIVYAAGGCVVVSDLSDPHNQVFLRGHDDFISAMAMSASGRFIASGQEGENADVIVWDFEEKKLLYRMQSHDAGIACLAFSHDEKLLLSVGVPSDNRILAWDMASGLMNAQATPSSERPPQPNVTCACWGGFFKDIKRRDTANYMLATAGKRSVRLWALDPMTGQWPVMGESFAAHSHVRDYTCLAFSNDRLHLLAGSTTGDVTVFQIKGRQLASSKQVVQGGVESILMQPPDDRGHAMLLVGGGTGTVAKLLCLDAELHDVRDGTTSVEGGVSSINASPDRSEAIVGTTQSFILRMRVSDLKSVLVCDNHSAAVTAITFPPDSSDRFATCSEDGTVRMWDLSDYSVLCKGFCRDGGTPLCIAFAMECLLTGWSDGKIRCFDGETGETLWSMSDVHRGGVTAIKVSHNQRFLMTGGEGGHVRIWDIKSREMVSHMKEHSAAVTCISIFEDDAHAVTGSKDRLILCWDLRMEKRVASLRQRMGGVNDMVLYLDQMQVVSVGQERRLTFWDLRDTEPTHAIQLSAEATALSLSRSGQLLATGGKDQMVRLWRFDGGSFIQDGMGHSGAINRIVFSPDDRQMVSVGEDGCILIWNVYS